MKIKVKEYYRPNSYDTVNDLLDLLCSVSHDIDNEVAVRSCLRRCIDDLCLIWAEEVYV